MDEQLNFLPKTLVKMLMPFQKEGILFSVAKHGRCLIADEMGLGKTIQGIGSAYRYKDHWPLLIVVPASLRYCWIEELEKWLPDLEPGQINLIQGGSDVSGLANSLITIVTYGLLRHPASHVVKEALFNQEFKVVIADESHYMKNRKSATTKYLEPLLQKAQHVILLSGTPALARPAELYPQISILQPNWMKWTDYTKRYCDAHMEFFGRNRRWVTDGASNLHELQNFLTSSVMIRRLKKDVLTQLPAKRRQKIAFDVKDSVLKKDLDTTRKDFDKFMDSQQMSVHQVICNETTALDHDSPKMFQFMTELHTKTCAVKIGPVREYVHMLCENEGLKFLLFGHHRKMMDALTEQLNEDKIKHIRIDGSTMQQDRPRLVKQFQSDPSTRVALLSMKAAGVGLTLTAASVVVFAELDWTPGTMDQCEDRAHRIGQVGTVTVQYLVAKETLDEWVWAALERKTSVITTTLNGRTQVLRAERGNNNQVATLSNADAFIPSNKVPEEWTFQLHQPSNQKSLLDFFKHTPKAKTDHMFVIDDSDDFQPSSSIRTPERSEASRLCTPSSPATPKSSSTPSAQDCSPEAKWECSKCTFINNDALLRCEVCYMARKPTVKEQSRGKGKRKRNGASVLRKSDILSRVKAAGILSSTPKSSNIPSIRSTTPKSSKIPRMEVDGEEGNISVIISSDSDSSVEVVEDSSDTDCYSLERHSSGEECEINRSQFSQGGNTLIDCEDIPQDKGSVLGDISVHKTSIHKDRITSTDRQTGREDGTATNGSADQGSPVLDQWTCTFCDFSNSSTADVCEVCFDPRPATTVNTDLREAQETDLQIHQKVSESRQEYPQEADSQSHPVHDEKCSIDDNIDVASLGGRRVDLNNVPVYDCFLYKCSLHTQRIFLFDKHKMPLHLNFVPLDVEVGNYNELPDVLLHPDNFKQIKRFVRQWNNLTVTKRRLVIRYGQIFSNPCLLYEELRKKEPLQKQRYLTKEDVCLTSVSAAEALQGSVRHIKPSDGGKSTKDQLTTGYIQPVDAEGRPLCIQCHVPYSSELVSTDTLEKHTWATRFCSWACRDAFLVRSNRSYSIEQIFAQEHGICQLCGFKAHEFFLQIKSCSEMCKRLALVKGSKYKCLPASVKERMVKLPSQGQFWQVDHIQAVSDGGGQCDLDNLRTLCTVCHAKVTKEQQQQRVKKRRREQAVGAGDITAFFKPL